MIIHSLKEYLDKTKLHDRMVFFIKFLISIMNVLVFCISQVMMYEYQLISLFFNSSLSAYLLICVIIHFLYSFAKLERISSLLLLGSIIFKNRIAFVFQFAIDSAKGINILHYLLGNFLNNIIASVALSYKISFF